MESLNPNRGDVVAVGQRLDSRNADYCSLRTLKLQDR